MLAEITLDSRDDGGNRVTVSRQTDADSDGYDVAALTVVDAIRAADVPRHCYQIAKIVEWAAELNVFDPCFRDVEPHVDAMCEAARAIVEFWDGFDAARG